MMFRCCRQAGGLALFGGSVNDRLAPRNWTSASSDRATRGVSLLPRLPGARSAASRGVPGVDRISDRGVNRGPAAAPALRKPCGTVLFPPGVADTLHRDAQLMFLTRSYAGAPTPDSLRHIVAGRRVRT